MGFKQKHIIKPILFALIVVGVSYIDICLPLNGIPQNTAHARSTAPSPIYNWGYYTSQKTNYTKFEKEIQPWANDNIKNAVIPAYLPMACTINFVSSDGHFLTARHCVEQCLLDKGLIKKSIIPKLRVPEMQITNPGENEPTDEPKYKVISYSDQDLYSHPLIFNKKISCPIEVRETFGVKATSATIAYLPQGGWLGRDTQTEFSFNYPQAYKKLLNQNYDAPSDFVVMKLGGTRNSIACLKLADRWPKIKETLNNRAFPFNIGGVGSSGIALKYGMIPIKPTASYLWQRFPSVSEDIFVLPKTFIATTAGHPGTSGSAVLSTADEILGIHHGMVANYISQSHRPSPPGFLAVVAAKAIRDQIISDVGQDGLNEMFSCDR